MAQQIDFYVETIDQSGDELWRGVVRAADEAGALSSVDDMMKLLCCGAYEAFALEVAPQPFADLGA